MTHNGNTIVNTSSKIPIGRLPTQSTLSNSTSYVPLSSAVYAAISAITPLCYSFTSTSTTGYIVRFPNIKVQLLFCTYSASITSDKTSSLISFTSYPFADTAYTGFVTANVTTSSGNNTDIGGYFVPNSTTGFYIRNDGGKTASTFYILAIGKY